MYPLAARLAAAGPVMNAADFLFLLILLVAVSVSAFCSASETAIFSLTFGERTRLSRSNPRIGAAVGKLLVRPRGFLLAILLLANLANVTYFVVSSVMQLRVPGTGVGLAINLGALLVLILAGDLLPKLLARSRRIEFCRVVAPVLVVVMRVVGPVSGILERAVVEPLLRVLHPDRPKVEGSVTADELATLLELSAKAGEIEIDEQRLLGDVVELGTTRVRDIMTPRMAMPWLPESATQTQIEEVVRATGATRIPVFQGSIDGRALGLLDVKGYLPEAASGVQGVRGKGAAKAGAGRLGPYLLPAMFVPEQARLDQLLEQFRMQGQTLALCVSEFGAVEGMVQIGDVLDELLSPGGEGGASAGPQVSRLGEDQWVIPGRLSVRELAEYFFGPGGRAGASIDRRASTAAGLVYVKLGRVPRVGDSIRVGNVVLTVQEVNGRAIERIVVSVTRTEGAAEQAGGGAR